MQSIFSFIQELLSEPAILVALVAMVGLLAQKKAAPDVIKGTLKTSIGFLVIGAGAGVVVASLDPFGIMFQEAFHVRGVVPNNEAIVAVALKEFGSITALIMFFGMIANILIARFTVFKYIFLTGHHTLYMACMIGVILKSVGMTNTMTVIVGSTALGVIMVLFPALLQRYTRKITGDDSIALGHFGSVGYLGAAYVGSKVGKHSRSTEEVNFPKSLSFLRDSSVAIALTMIALYLVVALATGPNFIESELSDGKNYLVYAIMQGVTFAAGIFVILAGVRLVLNEIVPAFKGISDKLIPGAKPAIDCPIVYPYAPNAVLIGFLCSFVGGLVGLAVLAVVGGTLILPGVVPHFFTGATAGVYGNATGGIRGATIGSFINGMIITFLPLFLMPVLGDLGFANSTFSDSDFGVAGIFLGQLGKVSPAILTIGVFGVLALMIIVPKFMTKPKTEKQAA